MVPSPFSSATVAFSAPERLRKKFSFGSLMTSELTGTETLLEVVPGLK
jgi:hypothetical protein